MDKEAWERNLKQSEDLLANQKESVEDLTFIVECYKQKIKEMKDIPLNNKQ